MCELTDSSVAPDKRVEPHGALPPGHRPTGQLHRHGHRGRAEVDQVAAQRDELVRGAGDFGIRKAFPAAEQKKIAIKNGWIDRTREQEMHINCLAIGDSWTIGVMAKYAIDKGYEYGIKNCEKITEALLRPGAGAPPAPAGRLLSWPAQALAGAAKKKKKKKKKTGNSYQPAKNSGPPSGSAGASPMAVARRAHSRSPAT